MAKMKLNIQRFTDLDFESGQTEALISILNTNVPKIAGAIDNLTDGVTKLTEDWGDGNAVQYGNEFTKAYRKLVQAANEYINSVGGWASSVGNAFAEQYAIGTRFNFNRGDVTKNAPDFIDKNSDGLEGPKDDNVANVFDNTYNASISEIESGLNAINNGFSENPNAFVADAQNDAQRVITEENAKIKNALDETANAYIQFLKPYVERAVELKIKSQNAANGFQG